MFIVGNENRVLFIGLGGRRVGGLMFTTKTLIKREAVVLNFYKLDKNHC